MDIETFRARCRDAALGAARARAGALGVPRLSPATARDLADEAVRTEVERLPDASLMAHVQSAGLLDRMAGSEGEAPLRDILRGALRDDALLRLEPDLEAALIDGQDAGTLAESVEAALAALDRAMADGRVGFGNRDAVGTLLADTDQSAEPLYAALCNAVASALRDAGEQAPAEALLAAQEGHVLVTTSQGLRP